MKKNKNNKGDIIDTAGNRMPLREPDPPSITRDDNDNEIEPKISVEFNKTDEMTISIEDGYFSQHNENMRQLTDTIIIELNNFITTENLQNYFKANQKRLYDDLLRHILASAFEKKTY